METLEEQNIEMPYKVLIFENNTYIGIRAPIIREIFTKKYHTHFDNKKINKK